MQAAAVRVPQEALEKLAAELTPARLTELEREAGLMPWDRE